MRLYVNKSAISYELIMKLGKFVGIANILMCAKFK